MFRSLWVFITLLSLTGFLQAEEEFPYRYRGILGRFALLENPRNGKQVLARPGVTIEGWKVVSLDRKNIRLTRNGQQIDLLFEKLPPEESGFTPPPYPYEIPLWKLEIQRRLREFFVKLDYTAVPLQKVLQDLSDKSQIRFVSSPRIEAEIPAEKRVISLQSPPIPLSEALRLVLAIPDLHAYPDKKGLRIALRSQSPPIDRSEEILQDIEWARPYAYKNWNTGSGEKSKTRTQISQEELKSHRVTLHTEDPDFHRLLRQLLKNLTITPVVAISIYPVLDANKPFQIKASNAPLAEVLDKLLSPLELDYIIRGSVIFIDRREKIHALEVRENRRLKNNDPPPDEHKQLRKIQVDIPPKPLPMIEFLQILEKRSGLPVRPGRDVWRMNLRIEIPAEKSSLFDILEHLAQEYRIYGSIQKNNLYLVR